MKIFKILVCSLFFISSMNVRANDAFRGFEWYDLVETVEVNREKSHAYFIPYSSTSLALENEKSALTKDIYKSDLIQSLNGDWKFYLAKDPNSQLSFDAFEDWDTSKWDTIKVPSNIQLHFDENNNFKYDLPIYTNALYPWVNYEKLELSEYPKAPIINNSVAHYKRDFILDESLDDRQIFINLDGVGSAFYLYVNNKRVGYSEDSYANHQFNITDYLNRDASGSTKGQKNTLALQVYRFSLGSYLENQDMINLNGIFRDVYLVSKDDVEIRDVFIKSTTDDITRVEVDVNLRNLNAKKSVYRVELEVYDKDDRLIKNNIKADFDLNDSLSGQDLINDEGVTKTLETSFKANLWDYDNPYLYRFLLILKDEHNNIIEVACFRYGIRDIERVTSPSGGQILLNGKPILIKGVNRHEIDAINGSALSKEDIIRDLINIKQNNINAIRCSHYPNNILTYELADEFGLYIMDEANIESHYGALVDDIPSYYPSFKNSVIFRLQNMVERDKNFTSILFFSLGNEATYKEYPLDDTYNFYQGSKWIRERIPNRLISYERDNRPEIVDIYSSQYYSLKEVENYLKKKASLPYIQSEYAHAMGNALGNLKEYWDLFRRYDNAHGGFIWDYKDQALYIPQSTNASSLNKDEEINKDYYYAYGGDFGEIVSDLEFSGNGLVFASNNPSSKLYEVKKVYQPFNFRQISSFEYEVTNDYPNKKPSDFNFSYAVNKDGILGEEKNIFIDESSKIKLDEIDLSSNSFVSIIFYVRYKDLSVYNKLKEINSYEEFILKDTSYKDYKNKKEDLENLNLTYKEDENTYNIKGENFEVSFSKDEGIISAYKFKNKLIFEDGPYLNFTRAQISNDTQFEFNENKASLYAYEMEDVKDQVKLQSISISEEKDHLLIKTRVLLKYSKYNIIVNYKIYNDGSLEIQNKFKVKKNLSGIISRLGFELVLPERFKNVTYFGKGPFENYIDRNSAALKQVYTSEVDNIFTKEYLKPQENGNRTDISWYKISDEETNINIYCDNLEISYIPYNHNDLRKSRHYYELKNSSYNYLNIAYMNRGLGNAICKDLPLEKYTIESLDEVDYSFRISFE